MALAPAPATGRFARTPHVARKELAQSLVAVLELQVKAFNRGAIGPLSKPVFNSLIFRSQPGLQDAKG